MHPLKLAGALTALASLAHFGIIIGGADWYRFFGAGEQMAIMSEQGSIYPAVVTAFIANMLALWAAYAFSAANVIGKLPFTKLALVLIALVFLARGTFAVPAVLLVDDSYLQELANKMTFMVVTSIYCLVLGVCYASGAYQLITQQSAN